MKNILFILLINFVLIAQSEDATLTIYKDGTAMVKQPVGWSIPSGYSYVTWSSLPNGIYRDTPFLNIEGADILSQRFNDNIFTGTDFFKSLRGEEIQVKPKNGKLVKGTLLEISAASVTISHQSGIMSFNRGELEYLGNKTNELSLPTFNPFLSWDLKSKSDKIIKGELVYRTKNFSWNTVYRLKVLNEEKGELIAEAVISNTSDMSFDNSSLKLVEGNLNRYNEKRPRPERLNMPITMAAQNAASSMIDKNELGD